jgi:N-acyl-L-homoserine lactone synthetase
MEIVTLTPETLHTLPFLMEKVYHARKAVFIDRLRWDIPPSGNIETDQYDVLGTHVIATDGLDLLGYMCLLSTTGPHMLANEAAFADLCDAAPRGPEIWEVTRLFILKRNNEVAPLMRDYLRAWAHANGVDRFILETDKFVLARIEKWGWNTQIISKPDAQWPVVIIK